MVGFDVPVVLAFVPVAEEGVAEVVLEVVNDPSLSASLDLADGSHRALPEPGSGEGSRSVVDPPSTFQYPPLSGPTRSIFPAARNLSSRYRTVDVGGAERGGHFAAAGGWLPTEKLEDTVVEGRGFWRFSG